jgi:hypothetical protein
MIVDTPIVDPHARSEITDVVLIQDRLERARDFLGYLDSQWALLPHCDLPFDWPSIKKQVERDIDYVDGKVSLREDILNEDKTSS